MSTAIKEAKLRLTQKGYLDVEVDPGLDLVAEINKLKKQKTRKHSATVLLKRLK